MIIVRVLATAVFMSCICIIPSIPALCYGKVPDTPLISGLTNIDPKQTLGNLHIPFIENRGQAHPSVKFYAPTFGGTASITKEGEIVYSLHGSYSSPQHSPAATSAKQHKLHQLIVTERLIDANIEEIKPSQPSVTNVSIFHGDNPDRWKSSLAAYDEISLGHVYDGIEVRINAHGNRMEKLFLIDPQADPASIRLQIPEARRLHVMLSGELEAILDKGAVRFSPPIAWQEINGRKAAVEVAYTVNKNDEYGFQLGPYDKQQQLIIDPLLQSTYIGDVGADFGYAIAVAPDSSVYIAGRTGSPYFPMFSGNIGFTSADTTFEGYSEGFVAKLSPDLSNLVQATFLGGNTVSGEVEQISALVLDSNGDIYVAGQTTSADFPGRNGQLGLTPGSDTTISGQDGFVAKLSGNLRTLYQSTFIGGSGVEEINDIAIRSDGEIFVVGTTYSSDLPACLPASSCNFFSRPDSVFAGSSEAFIARFTSNLRSMWSTFVGGPLDDSGTGIVIPRYGDNIDDVYITGTITRDTELLSSSFPGIDGGDGYNGLSPDGYDITVEKNEAFVSWVNPSLMSIFRSTFFGGSSDDSAADIAEGTDGSIYIVGRTASYDMPRCTAPGCPSMADDLRSGWEGFAARLNPSLTNLYGSTYLGGGGQTEYAASIATMTDPKNIYGTLVLVGGVTNSTDFPGLAGGFDATLSGGTDGFVALLSTELDEIQQATLYGGSLSEELTDVAFSTTGDIYIAGVTLSPDLPKSDQGFITSPSSAMQEGFSAHFSSLAKGGSFYIIPQKNGTCPVIYLGK